MQSIPNRTEHEASYPETKHTNTHTHSGVKRTLCSHNATIFEPVYGIKKCCVTKMRRRCFTVDAAGYLMARGDLRTENQFNELTKSIITLPGKCRGELKTLHTHTHIQPHQIATISIQNLNMHNIKKQNQKEKCVVYVLVHRFTNSSRRATYNGKHRQWIEFDFQDISIRCCNGFSQNNISQSPELLIFVCVYFSEIFFSPLSFFSSVHF